ncbi:Ubiquitin carboxyl-terminal hydrolase, partial [Geosmithia morbida]
TRPFVADVFRSRKQDASKDGAEDKKAVEAKVAEVQRRLDDLGIQNVTADHIKEIMTNEYAQGDPEKTADFIDIEQKSSAGIIVPYDPQVHMVGAENRKFVTCYLDTLLFSMFAKMDAFECILKNKFPPEDSRNKLANLLRLWVNMLRTGKLIHTDLTELIQETLAECGWADARELEQQDTSEAFAFITETLQLPLLTLQVDLFHHGKRDKDDHKVVYERLLNLAVPPDPEGRGIRLEDCLEDYFNTQVDVMRDSVEPKKSVLDELRHEGRPSLLAHHGSSMSKDEASTTAASLVSTDSPTSLNGHAKPDDDNEAHTQRAHPDLHRSTTWDTPPSRSGKETAEGGLSNHPRATRHRSASVIQSVVIDESGHPSAVEGPATARHKSKWNRSTVVKAVTIPAWQFFKLIPWHAVSSTEPKNNLEVAMNFDQRPVVGICLKRYLVTESGQPQRHNTYIDIPDSLRLPRFMLAGGSGSGHEDRDGPVLDTEYKLVLQSVICHRGDNLQCGHYFSFARVAPRVLTDNRRLDIDPPPDYEEAQWVKFDDLEVDQGRVTYVENIKQALKEAMPYLLFYQVVPMVDAPSSDGTAPEPPSYDDFRAEVANLDGSKDITKNGDVPPAASSDTLQSPTSKPPSIRFSTEMERRSKSSDMTTAAGGQSLFTGLLGQIESRRQSMNLTDSAAATPARTPEWQQSPLAGPVDETTASRLSRAAARFKGRQSRPPSQSGENRVSSAMSRVAGLMIRPSRDSLSKDGAMAEPPALSISKSGSINGRLSASMDESRANSTESVVPYEEDKATPTAADAGAGAPPAPVTAPPSAASTRPSSRQGAAHKNGHTRNKSTQKDKDKEKAAGKRKAVSHQPERECTVM